MSRAGKGEDAGSTGVVPVLCTVLVTLALSVPTTALLAIYFRCGEQPSIARQISSNSSDWEVDESVPSERFGGSEESWEVSENEKPAAHLIGIYQHAPEPHQTLEWESVRGLAFTKDSVRYLGRSLVIPRHGLYYVYCQVGFRGSDCHSRSVTLYNWVYRKHDSYPEPLLLLAGTETVCGKNHNRGAWYTTLGQGAVVELEKDHQLFVNVSNPHLVDYLDGKTFFGVIKI